jgi:hypothetical protein
LNPKPFRPIILLILFVNLTLLSISISCRARVQKAAAPSVVISETEAIHAVPAEPLLNTPIPTDSIAAAHLIDQPPQPAISELRQLILEYPPRIRLGDSDVIRLSFAVDQSGMLTPTAVITGREVRGETFEIPNLYESHRVIAEARLDMAGMDLRPSEVISEPMLPGQSVTFFWSIHPPAAGKYRGTVWLHLRFVDKSNGAQSQSTLSAQIVEIEAVNFFGLSANFARLSGALGCVIGGILGFPFFEQIIKIIFPRRRKS